jgi:hypothetical protein
MDVTRSGDLEDLKFLVGTACSRLINLLMDPRVDPATLQAEAAFMAEKAGSLAELLAEEAGGPEEPVG